MPASSKTNQERGFKEHVDVLLIYFPCTSPAELTYRQSAHSTAHYNQAAHTADTQMKCLYNHTPQHYQQSPSFQ
jgi:hypothetical protein